MGFGVAAQRLIVGRDGDAVLLLAAEGAAAGGVDAITGIFLIARLAHIVGMTKCRVGAEERLAAIFERAAGLEVDRTASRVGIQIGRKGFDHLQFADHRGRQQIQTHAAGDRAKRAVRCAGRGDGQPVDGDVVVRRPQATQHRRGGFIARMLVVGGRQHRQTRHAAQRLDDGAVGQGAHIGGADHIGDVGRSALAFHRRRIGAAHAGDLHGIERLYTAFSCVCGRCIAAARVVERGCVFVA